MSKEKSSTTRLGIFVTLATIIFIIVVYNIGNKQSLFGSTFKITSVFNNVNGLQKGNNVRYSGINVGTVDNISFLSDSTLRVEMTLDKKIQSFLKKDAIASIGTDGLVGNMIVNISPGSGMDQIVEDGDQISSYTRIEAENMLTTLGQTTDNIALLTLNLLEIAEKINSGQGSLFTLINDSIMAADLKRAVTNLKISTQNMNTLSGQFRSSIEEVTQGKGVLGYLLKDTTFEDQLNHLYSNLDTLITTRTTPILDNLERSSLDISATTNKLKNIIQDLDLNQGLTGTLLYDSAAAEDLIQTLENLNEGTDRFNQNMEALKHNFLFRKYFKKQERALKKLPDQKATSSD
jgi:phospholipid/cholesterol/gamma-HCH transport system substrate-binding protein